MADQFFATSPYGKALFNALGGRRPTIGILGDSYGSYLAAAIQYACAKYYPADIEFDHRTYANGGRLFSVGGSTSEQMVSNQVPQMQARPADVMFIWTGWNDGIGDQASAVAISGNVITAANACLTAGAKLVVICGHGPKPSATSWAVMSYNALLAAYARATPGVMFLDATAAMVDPATSSATSLPFRGGTSVIGGYTTDNTHPSAFAVRTALAPLVAQVLERVARRRRPRAVINAEQFDPATRPDVDLLPAAGLMRGTDGRLNDVDNANVAGVWPIRWNIGTAGGVTVTPSIVTGADGFKRQRMTLGGSGLSGAYIYFSCFVPASAPNGGDATKLYDAEGVVELTGVTGVNEIVLNSEVHATAAVLEGGAASASYPDNTTEGPLFFYHLYGMTLGDSNPVPRFVIYFRDGSTPSGIIDISRVSLRRIAP